MSNKPQHNADGFGMPSETNDMLMQYVQTLDIDTIKRLAKPTFPEVIDIVKRAVTAILKNLPFDEEHRLVITERDQLGQLLAAVMVDGYFLRNAEQRLDLEKIAS